MYWNWKDFDSDYKSPVEKSLMPNVLKAITYIIADCLLFIVPYNYDKLYYTKSLINWL